MPLASKELGNAYPLVLLHGFCEDKSCWDGFLQSLSVSNRVICLDLPGFGGSQLLHETSMESVADAVYEDLKSKNVSECIMIGHSLGGYITLAIAERYPKFLKAFGLFHSTALADTEEKKDGRNKTLESLKMYGKKPFLKTFVPSLYNQDRLLEYQEVLAKSVKMGEATPLESMIAYTEAMRDRINRLHIVQQSKVPILFIAGEKDNAITLDKSLLHQAYIKPENFHLLKNVGHMGFYEEPGKCFQIISTFIEKVED